MVEQTFKLLKTQNLAGKENETVSLFQRPISVPNPIQIHVHAIMNFSMIAFDFNHF